MKPWPHKLLALTLCGIALALTSGSVAGCRQTMEVSKRPTKSDGAPMALADTRWTNAGKSQEALVFRGACDASGAVPLDGRHFLVADDEDNTLRVYDAVKAGHAVSTVDLSAALAKNRKKKEFDLEGATRLGDTAFFITSHGRNSKAKRDPNRLLFFALSLSDPKYAIVGTPYAGLLDDVLKQPMFADLGLARAAELAPKAVGGLNIEGLTATPEGQLWVGLRNPIPDDRAILFRIDNPTGIINGEAPSLSSLSRLDLAGLGVRALSFHQGSYLIAAGPPGEGGPFRLYKWDGAKSVVEVPNAVPAGLNPEGFFTPESSASILLLSDDGSRPVGERPCKKLKDSSLKQFRAFPLVLP